MWMHNEKMPDNPTQFSQFLDSGAVYIPGRLSKKGMQPVIVIDIKKFVTMDLDVPTLEENLKFIFNWAVQHMCLTGHVEQFFIIVDLTDVGVLEIPVKKLKPFVKVLQYAFKGRMFRLVSCNTNFLMRGIYNIVSLWLSEFERQSMILCAKDECIDELVKYMPNNEIEQRFGGLKPNIQNYFPPAL